jgi:glycine dehydrogenase
MKIAPLNYQPESIARELKPYYISASEKDVTEMLQSLRLKNLNALYSHIDPVYHLSENLGLGQGLKYEDLLQHVNELAQKNTQSLNFIHDGLPDFEIPDVVGPICNIRGLTTAYTPYQPERSQGTLQTLWIYQSLLSQLTGFEAINASLYERSTCLFEAIASRLIKDSTTAIVSEGIYPGDLEVLETLCLETPLKILKVPLDPETGLTSLETLKKILNTTPNLCAVAFPQVNCLGLIEKVDEITDLVSSSNLKSIAIVDPLMIAPAGLKAPVHFGSKKQGTDMVVAEGQHLTLAPNFGGPGLGIFGIRYHEQDKISIRSTAGRYVGKTVDLQGRECKALILSTREQHIRREKATSNICSNQSFVASIAGASLFARGDEGLEKSFKIARENAVKMVEKLTCFEGVELKFRASAFVNEITLKINQSVDDLIFKAAQTGLALGVNVSSRVKSTDQLLMLAFSDKHREKDLQSLLAFFEKHFKDHKPGTKAQPIPTHLSRVDLPGIPKLKSEEIIKYYQKLGEQNLSPDDGIYPLGSCTMKYNPMINDYAAGLGDFTKVHPEAHPSLAQGCLAVLYEIQEMFKKITGLPGVTTQPVAGAQGELVGLKMFQAYHRDRGEEKQRDLILIPRSAHGTNPATATTAGYFQIQLIEATPSGEFNLEQMKMILKSDGHRVAGIMVTNPNTSGIFESKFGEMSKLIHEVGGLVYMDGANMNAIAGVIDLNALGVDAVHNNLHKTWTIPHGGGGPGDAIVAVSSRLIDYLPGMQIKKNGNEYLPYRASKSVGSFHRHWGNFAHKVRAYTYIKALGDEGVRKMSQVAVLCSCYLFERLSKKCPSLPSLAETTPRMHEFILTLSPEMFKKIEAAGTPKNAAIPRVGKLFLDFGFHAPTVAFPEVYGLMIEPTESYSKDELDKFATVVETIMDTTWEHPEVLKTVPHFTPIDRVDEVAANKNPTLTEKITDKLPEILPDRVDVKKLKAMTPRDLVNTILEASLKS